MRNINNLVERRIEKLTDKVDFIFDLFFSFVFFSFVASFVFTVFSFFYDFTLVTEIVIVVSLFIFSLLLASLGFKYEAIKSSLRKEATLYVWRKYTVNYNINNCFDKELPSFTKFDL